MTLLERSVLETTPFPPFLPRCMSPEVALSGNAAKADLSPECAPKRRSVDHFDLMGSRPNLSVLPVHGIEWSDLGEPLRVMTVLSRLGIHPDGAAA